MGWHAHLQLDYRRDGDRTTALDRHHGPLRVLQRLYPEGDAICHHVLVHPPGGIVGGDTLALQATLAPGSHAVITTPGATRFYRSEGDVAHQQVQATLAPGARLEWLPMETIAYSGCEADNRLHFDLAPGAQMLGWDVLALGLPAANAPFDARALPARQIHPARRLAGTWHCWTAAMQLLLQQPAGPGRPHGDGQPVAGRRFGVGPGRRPRPWTASRTEALVDAARALIDSERPAHHRRHQRAPPQPAGAARPGPPGGAGDGACCRPCVAPGASCTGGWTPKPPRVWRT